TILDDLAEHRPGRDRQGFTWFELDESTLARYMPFWTAHDIQRVSKSLSDKGVVLLGSAPFLQSRQLIFAFNEQRALQQESPVVRPQAHNTPVRGANRIPPNWQPSDDVWQQL